MILEFRRDPDQIDAPQRVFDCLLAIRPDKLVAQDPLALDFQGIFCDVNRQPPLDADCGARPVKIGCRSIW
ncbi:hypothetical protein GWG65_39270 [Bradyrhizobium sp. CSA207]|uniref:hypothetical protein n=1 Tax=Bradyrhizobium sp. CSA207 TaxID=2698826 RepID=UPI0023B1C217|nr:hypothetical protein [Bradyrhizobium sp. CSA207]MDE5447246.1 hypothetical protein [Bradyrhizobium sp. CSA207]